MTFQFREWDKRRPLHTNPSLDYLAPEYILSKSCNELSDIYSYGMLCYAAYNHGKPLYESQNNMLSFKQNVEQVCRGTQFYGVGTQGAKQLLSVSLNSEQVFSAFIFFLLR